jgi:N-acetylglutamate synthase-like GNAT family acetyltransferase
MKKILSTIVIRQATTADAVAILAMQKEAYQSEAELYGEANVPPLHQTPEEMIRDIQTMMVLVGSHDAEIVGSVRVRLDEKKTAHVGRLIVQPDCQNQGLGRRLLAEIETAVPDAKRFELFTGHKSLKNLHLYQKAGYVEFDRKTAGSDLTLIYLRKAVQTTP